MEANNVKNTGLSLTLDKFALVSAVESADNEYESAENNNQVAPSVTNKTAAIDENIRVVVSGKVMKKKKTIWTADKQRHLRDLGQKYVGYNTIGAQKKRVVRPAKKIKACCKKTAKCRTKDNLNCNIFETDVRKQICSEFWKSGEKNRIAFVLKHVVNENKGGRDSRKYFLPLNENQFPVCSLMFTSTLCIDRMFIGRLIKNKIPDQIHRPIRSCPDSLKEAHLNTFFCSLETLPSHYNRLNSSKKYLTRSVESIMQLFNEYKERQESLGYESFGRSKFFEKFNESNLSIYQPLRDRCEQCQTLEIGMKNGDAFAEQKFADHRQEVNYIFNS